MATRFEIALYGPDPASLRAAAEEALDEVDRLEGQLSLYRNTSDIARINRQAASEPVRVEPRLFQLLERAKQLSEQTGYRFDITVAPLMRCWGFLGGTGKMTDTRQVAEAKNKVGMHLVELDNQKYTVRFAREGMQLDLGAIAKGHAVEVAAELLEEAGVTSAMIHGGTSTIFAIGAPPDASAWKIAIEYPADDAEEKPKLLAVVELKNEALSVSAVWGKSFEHEGRTYGHLIDPRTGKPLAHGGLAAVVLPSATESDAFSTALLTAGLAEAAQICCLRPEMRTLLAIPNPSEKRLEIKTRDIKLQPGTPASEGR